jgi:hypothetical protein
MASSTKRNLTDFYDNAVRRDFARVFQFSLLQIGNTSFLDDDQLVYVETAALPGKSINNIAVPYMGLQFNVPGTISYPGSDSYNIQFRCDADYQIRGQLEEALRQVWDDNSSTGEYGIPSTASIMSLALYDKGSKFTDDRANIRQYDFYGMYVKTLADAQYDIKDNGAIVTITATIAYQYWRVTGGSNGTAESRTSNVAAPLPPLRSQVDVQPTA